MTKKIRFDDPNKLTARHILLDGSSIEIAYRGESPEYYLYHIADSHVSDYNEIMIYKDYTNRRGVLISFEDRKNKTNTNRIITIPHLKDRDKLLSKMISFHKSAV
jgi:hypothetical protein